MECFAEEVGKISIEMKNKEIIKAEDVFIFCRSIALKQHYIYIYICACTECRCFHVENYYGGKCSMKSSFMFRKLLERFYDFQFFPSRRKEDEKVFMQLLHLSL